MSVNDQVLENWWPTWKIPSAQMRRMGMQSCTLRGMRNFTRSCFRALDRVLINGASPYGCASSVLVSSYASLPGLHRSNSCCNDRPAAWGSGARICTTPKTTARRSYCGRRRIRKPRRARRPRCRPSRLPLFPAADGAKNKRPLPPRGPTVSR